MPHTMTATRISSSAPHPPAYVHVPAGNESTPVVYDLRMMHAGSGAAQPDSCTSYASVDAWDTCSSFAVVNGLHLHSLKALNPSLDCGGRLPTRCATCPAPCGSGTGMWQRM
jgi:hypothetical protein